MESRIEMENGVALTQAQDGLWVGQHLAPENPVYNTGEYIEIRGALDVGRFASAVNRVMQEAQVMALQVGFSPEGGAVQWLNPQHVPQLEVIDLRGEVDSSAAAFQAMQADMGTPLDLQKSPLAVQRLFCLADGHFYWYQRAHHLLLDGWGQSLINTQVAAVYRGDLQQPPLMPYGVWLEQDRAYQGSEYEQRDKAFWQACFAQTPVVADLTLGQGGVPITESTVISFQKELPVEFEKELTQLCVKENHTWPDVLTALAGAYIGRYSTASETVIGVPYMGRMGQPCARVPATVMNVLPLKVAGGVAQPLSAFLSEVSHALRQVRRHGRYRSEQLRRDLDLLGGHKRLYGAVVNVLPFDDLQLDVPDGQVVRHPLGNGPVEDLTVTFRANALGQHLRLELDANPARYTQQMLETHALRLVHFIRCAMQAQCLAEVPTLTPDEHSHWVYGCNDTAHEVPETTLVHLFEQCWQEMTEQEPEKAALEYEGQQLSYAQLERKTATLANQLNQSGVGRGDIVAVAIPRSLELVVAMVGVMRAGAAYLPLDTESPRQRIATIVDAAKPKLALVSEQMRGLLPSNLPFEVLDIGALDDDADMSAVCRPEPFDMAYVLYTSGSTGTPKGVVIEHDAIVNRLLWMQAHYGIGREDRILQKTPATFDVSVWEFFLPLLCGATLVIAPPDAHKDPQHLVKIMQASRITVLHFVPSMLSVFLAYCQMMVVQQGAGRGENFFEALRLVFCSGEALPSELRGRFHALIGGKRGAELHNLYGPTEAAVDVSYWPASAEDTSQPVPIGYPVWNTQLYILDADFHPVPPGMAGHLYLGGRQLARGYLGREDLTDKAFVPNPFISGQRMYATGDLALRRDDDAVVFLGRSDFQIKIRGQRVELEEIEAVVARISDVNEVAIIAREDQLGDQRIVAYVVVAQSAELDESRLRQLVAEHLAEYMVPSAFVLMPELPVTSNGKLDRKALPIPAFVQQQGRGAPTTVTEQRVACLFGDVLGYKEPVYAEDDFFSLGGHSLLAAELMLAIRAQWGYAIGLGTLFEHPTVAQLASYLDRLEGETGADRIGREGFEPVLTLRQPQEEGEGVDCPALFCIHPAGGLGWCYGALAREMGPDRRVIGLQSPELDLMRSFPMSLQDMASSYVDEVVRIQPQGPYHVLGWSIGGIIAQAMAVELLKRGLSLGVVTMLDAYPSDCWRTQGRLEEGAAYKALMHIAGYDPQEMQGVELTRESVMAFLRRSGHPLGFLSDAQLQGIVRVVDGNNQLVREHHHVFLDASVLYFRAALDHEGENLYPALWQPYVRGMVVHDVPCLHAHLVSAQMVKKIAFVLNRAMIDKDKEIRNRD